MAKYGKKNVVKVDPLAYNLALFGESGIGKSTLAYEFQKKLCGDGYLHLNMGLESGVTALQGIIFEDVPNWTTFEEIINDIVENKEEDYPDLKVVTIDTVDELEKLGINEVIRLHNLKNPKEKTDSFNKTFGSFGRGYDKLEEIILNQLEKLKEVGVSVFLIGHVKRKTKIDPITENEYDIITAKMSNRIFTAIQTKLHVLGLAVVDRSIKEDIVGKDFLGKDKISKKIASEKRKIVFRDDNFAVESKSRFANIVDKIPFDTDCFITTITDAIKSTFTDETELNVAKKIQDKEKKEKVAAKIEEIKKEKEIKNKFGNKEEILESIKTFYQNTENGDAKAKIKESIHSLGLGKFDELLDCDYEAIINIYNITQE
jgi:hypothetical protein